MDRNKTLQTVILAFRRVVVGLWTLGAIVVVVWR
jgi:hypothetical protein